MNEDLEEGMAVDKAFAELFEAYQQIARLERAQTATEARDGAKQIKLNIERFADKMVRFGVRAEESWARLRRNTVRH